LIHSFSAAITARRSSSVSSSMPEAYSKKTVPVPRDGPLSVRRLRLRRQAQLSRSVERFASDVHEEKGEPAMGVSKRKPRGDAAAAVPSRRGWWWAPAAPGALLSKEAQLRALRESRR
jgi:hypothetical protein